MLPKISVVIPTFNSSKTIDRTLASVFNQTLKPHEIIVVDDGSSDTTAAQLEAYGSAITLFCQKNAGASAARNQGVALASGDVIAFLDSDDLWHKNKLEIQANIFLQNQDVGICSTGFKACMDTGQVDTQLFLNSATSAVDCKRVDFVDVFLHPYLATPTVAIRKNVFDALGGFDEMLETAEDVDLWIRACYATPYIFIKNALCYVMGQEGSLSTRAKKSPFESHLDVVEKFYRSQRDFAEKNYNLLKKSRSSIYTQWGSAELIQGRPKSAAHKLMLAIKNKPSTRALYLFAKSILLLIKPTTPK